MAATTTTPKAQRRYSLAEIDELRALTREIMHPGSWQSDGVEERLRTSMLGGVSVVEVRAQRDQQRADRLFDQAWDDAHLELKRRDCSHARWICMCWECDRSHHYLGRKLPDADCRRALYCAACDIPNRRKAQQGRPGGRRVTDTPRTSPAKPPLMTAVNTPVCSCGSMDGKHPVDCEVFAKPKPAAASLSASRRWWRFW